MESFVCALKSYLYRKIVPSCGRLLCRLSLDFVPSAVYLPVLPPLLTLKRISCGKRASIKFGTSAHWFYDDRTKLRLGMSVSEISRYVFDRSGGVSIVPLTIEDTRFVRMHTHSLVPRVWYRVARSAGVHSREISKKGAPLSLARTASSFVESHDRLKAHTSVSQLGIPRTQP